MDRGPGPQGVASFGSGFNPGVVGGFDPRLLSQRRSAILQKLMAQHAQNLPQNSPGGPQNGMNAIAQASHMQANGPGGQRPNATHGLNITGGQNLSAALLARLGLSVPRALPGEHSSAPGSAIDRTDAGGQFINPNYHPAGRPAPSYPGDPTNAAPSGPPGSPPSSSQYYDPATSAAAGTVDQYSQHSSGLPIGTPVVDAGFNMFQPDQQQGQLPSPYDPLMRIIMNQSRYQ